MTRWTNIYPEYAAGIRIVTLNKKPALLLPHFDHPSKHDNVLQAIEKTLRTDFEARGWYHGDLWWRNIGIRRSENGVRAVVFDMESVKRVSEMTDKKPDTDWVAAKITHLKKRM
jgi:hypothetical protein